MAQEKLNGCPQCGAPTALTVESHRYTEAGLPHVELVDVEIRRCTACDASALRLPGVEQLHREIAMRLVKRPHRLRGNEVRFLRKYLGFSSAAYAQVIGADDATVLAWESGAKPMPMRNEIAFRLLVLTRQPLRVYPAPVTHPSAPRAPKPPRFQMRSQPPREEAMSA